MSDFHGAGQVKQTTGGYDMDGRSGKRWGVVGTSLLLAAALLFGGVAAAQGKGGTAKRSCSPEAYALALAGASSIQCGTAQVRVGTEAVIKCLLDAQANGRPVRAKFLRQGIDSTIIDVFVRTQDGRSLVLHYDGDPTGGGGDGNPRLGQQRCARFERFDKYGPDVTCVDGVALPDLCPEGSQRDR